MATELVTLCDTLVTVGKSLDESVRTAAGADAANAQYKRAALAAIKLKHFNREVWQSLDVQRKHVETEKEKLETLKLKLENLLYKRAYLLREIRVLQDLTTPHLQSVEMELGRQLAVTSTDATAVGSSSSSSSSPPSSSSFKLRPLESNAATAANLATVEAAALVAMAEETAERERDMAALAALASDKQVREVVLDRKRKFLDDVPVKMAKIQATVMDDLARQFEVFRKELAGARMHRGGEGGEGGGGWQVQVQAQAQAQAQAQVQAQVQAQAQVQEQRWGAWKGATSVISRRAKGRTWKDTMDGWRAWM